jgi:hypothetical protein
MIKGSKNVGSGLAGLGVGIGVYFSICCCLIFFALNLGLIELADSYGILNSFWGISRLPPLVQPVGKRSYANKWIPVKDYENPDIQKDQIYSENRHLFALKFSLDF